jgi:sialic acid synthase SpsE
VSILRPASALAPADLDRLLGQTAAREINAGDAFTLSDISMAESA